MQQCIIILIILILLITMITVFNPLVFIINYFILPMIGSCIISIIARIFGFIFRKKLNSLYDKTSIKNRL
ncbi:putative membrane protein [Orientia chuto str. Dubai]|uniref:Putative membrane protein n=1 Tax=Orientia chuto str. Dubai TaxID=1359168 RepID=A0A0F3MR47_9RICK|nr:putative membrane protein [Orientia chuto str. Dubai]